MGQNFHKISQKARFGTEFLHGFIFIHSLVQFRQMRHHVDEVSDNPIAAPLTNATTTTAPIVPEDTAAEKIDVQEIISKLGFPLAICFVQIALYLVSAQYAWKSWKDSDGPTIQREILEEEPEDKNEPMYKFCTKTCLLGYFMEILTHPSPSQFSHDVISWYKARIFPC
jgi:hypothetical protein